MLDSVALDEAISNFRDVATSLDMTSGNGELQQLNTANCEHICKYMIFLLSAQCMFAVQVYRIHHYHIAQVWMWVGVVIYDM